MQSAFDNSSRRRRLFTLRDPVESTEDIASAPEESLSPVVKSGLKELPEPDVSQSVLTQFRRACRQEAAFIVKVVSSESGARAQTILWDRPSLIIGKGADCDLILRHAEISRQHAYLQIVNQRIFCADLDSRTGTHWSNGAAQAGWVDPEEGISIGPYSLTFESAPHVFDAESTENEFSVRDLGSGTAETSDAGFFLDFMNAGQDVRRYRVTRDVTLIGSGDAAKVHLSHSSVSKVHCSIVRTDSGLWMVDLHSSDGTIVNGHVEAMAPLHSGDEFQVGRFLVAVRYGELKEESGPQLVDSRGGRPRDREHVSGQLSHSVAVETVQTTPDAMQASTNLSALNRLAHLTSRMPPSSEASPTHVGGLSEQFVLNIIKELGIMQQQALQHAQESMKETISTLATTFQERIDALERQHATLRDELLRLSSTASPQVALPDPYAGVMPASAPWDGPDMADPEFADLPRPEQGAYECSDPVQREAWIRERMKSVESELDKTRRGWGKKLVEMLGY